MSSMNPDKDMTWGEYKQIPVVNHFRWETATDTEIYEAMTQVLKELGDNKTGYIAPTFIMPEGAYRLLSLEKRMTRLRKGPGKGRNRIVYVMRRG